MRCAAAFFAWRWFYTLWGRSCVADPSCFYKRDCFWQNREFSTNKLGLLTIYKSVIVPNTDNMKGLEAAAAAGIVAGKQEKKLEVIADVTPEQTKAIRAYLDQTDIKVRHVENGVTFDIILTVWKGSIPHRCALRCSTPISSMWKRTARYWWTFRYTETARRP